MKDLTHEQQRLLVSMYKEVVHRKTTMPFDEANYFLDSDSVRDLFFLNISSDQASSLCWDMELKGYIHCEPGDDLANDIVLTSQTISYMEKRFKNNLLAIADFISKFIP